MKAIVTNVGSTPVDSLEISIFPAVVGSDGTASSMTNLALQSSTSPTGMTCAVKTSDSSTGVTCTGGASLAPGASETLDAVTTGTFTNTPFVEAVTFAEGKANGDDVQGFAAIAVPVSPPPAGSAAATLPPSNEGASISPTADAFLEVSATTKPRACTSGTCDLVVTAQNENNVPLQGDVRLTITTTTSSNGTAAPPGSMQLISSDPAAGTCAVGADNTISCQGAQLAIPAEGSKDLTFEIKVTPPAGTTPDFFTFKANFAIGAFTGPAGGPAPANVSAEATTSALPDGGASGGGGGGAGGGTGGATGAGAQGQGQGQGQSEQACATIPVIKPTPPHLSLAKKATAGSCSDAGGGCDFKITVTNDGDTDFDGPVSFDDVVTADNAVLGTTQMTNGQAVGDFACSKTAQGFTCSSAGPIKIAAKTSVDHDVSFTLGAGTAAKEIENCAKLQNADQPQQCAAIPLVSGPLLRVKKFLKARLALRPARRARAVGSSSSSPISAMRRSPAP